MESFNGIESGMVLTATAMAGFLLVKKIHTRLQLSMAKHPSLGGHLRMAKRFASWIPGYSYSPAHGLVADGAPAHIGLQRKNAIEHLGQRLQNKSPQTLQMSAELKPLVSDLQLISEYRIPFQFREMIHQYIRLGSFWRESEGSYLTDMDGNRFIDVTGSYGVNLFGTDFYKTCIAKGVELAEKLGPVLGSYHPCVLDNARQLCELSGMQEVSFHMSGTEAVMQAVRLARYHTGKKKLVRFTGAYHGWWDDVQPGPGNPMPPSPNTLTLNDMHPNTLQVLKNRNDIACVLINPLQAMHPNKAAPTDSTLVDSSRSVHFNKGAYTDWLHQLRQVCTEKGIALIMDEVFMGFRLAPGGAQAYFNVKADMVTYGKTLGGGLPVGVVCGMSHWMRRFKSDKPAELCFARGTFNAHPYVMATMNVFLHAMKTPQIQDMYAQSSQLWALRLATLNRRLDQANLPVHIAGMETVWSILYKTPSRYNWMLQFYLRDQGIALSWVGSGRMIMNFGMDDKDFEVFMQRFVKAVEAMEKDGWWWTDAQLTNRHIRQSVFKEILKRKYLSAQ